MSNRTINALLLGLTVAIASQLVSAQIVDAQDRPLNVGLIGGVVVDANGRAVANAQVHLDQVAADVSECTLRIYGPNQHANSNVTTSENGVFLIAFEWEPEQLGCLIGGPAPRALLLVLVFDARNNYRKATKEVALLLAPNLSAILNGVNLIGALGKQANKRIEEATKDNPALKAYLRSLSEAMSIELYALLGDSGAITVARP